MKWTYYTFERPDVPGKIAGYWRRREGGTVQRWDGNELGGVWTPIPGSVLNRALIGGDPYIEEIDASKLPKSMLIL